MLLLLPIGLAALASLLLPLLVHLARRSEPRTVRFAALRWLRAQPQPQRKHRLEEWFLLLLRLLLLAALTLLLAQPVLFGKPDRRPWVVVAPQVDIATARRQVRVDGARWHSLAPDFPEVDAKQPPATGDAASFASLLRELDATLPVGTPLTVLVPQIIEGADAQRPVLSRAVDWQVAAHPSSAMQPAPKILPSAMPTLAVRYGPGRTGSLRYLLAAGLAWRAELGSGTAAQDDTTSNPVSAALLDQPVEPGTRRLAWLAPGVVPAAIRDWVERGGSVLLDASAQWPGFDANAAVVWRDEAGPLARGMNFGLGRVIRLERALVPAAMPGLLEPDFPRQLQSLFAAAPPAPARVDARDYALLSLVGVRAPVRLTEAAAELGMRLTTASDAVRRLEARGHVARIPNPADGRSWLFELSLEGDEEWRRGWPALRRIQASLEGLLGDQATVRSALVELGDALERALTEA